MLNASRACCISGADLISPVEEEVRPMSVWMPLAVWGVMKLAVTAMDWSGRLRYERSRAASVAAILERLPTGGTVRDVRADGTMFDIEVADRGHSHSHKMAGGRLAKRR